MSQNENKIFNSLKKKNQKKIQKKKKSLINEVENSFIPRPYVANK